MKWQWWLLSALLIRLCAAALFFIGPSSDAADYERLGASLAAGAGFSNPDGSPASWRAPGYPAFIAAVYSLAGRWPRAVALAQALLDTGTCLLLWWWARRRLGEEVARWVLPLAAVSLSMVASVRLLNSECLASFLTVSTCASLDAVKGRRGVVLGGVSAGALILVRTANLLFPGALLLALLVRRVSAAHLALFVTCVLACIVPWQLRNWYAVHSLAVATQGGATLYMSHFRQPGQPYGDMTHDEVTARAEQMRDAEADRYLRAETLRRLRETPGVFFRAIPEKLVYFFAPLDWEILGAGRGRTWNPLYVLAMVLAALGGVSLWRTQRETLVMALLPIAYLAVIAALYYGSPRFRLPTEPPLLLLSAAGLRRLVSRA